jgi:hypothetical protein
VPHQLAQASDDDELDFGVDVVEVIDDQRVQVARECVASGGDDRAAPPARVGEGPTDLVAGASTPLDKKAPPASR